MITEMLLAVLDKAKKSYNRVDAPLVRQLVDELRAGVIAGEPTAADGVVQYKVVLRETSPLLKSVYERPLDVLETTLQLLKLPFYVVASPYFHGDEYAVDIGVNVWGLLNGGKGE